MITGVRGAGKTVMMTNIASTLTQDKKWISVELNPERDILPEYDQYLDEYVYNKIWSELSGTDKEVLGEMARSRETDVTLIREALGMSTSKFSVYRDRLKRKGIVNASQYGSLFLILPRFEEFIKHYMG